VTTPLAGVSLAGMAPAMTVEGGTDTAVFDTCRGEDYSSRYSNGVRTSPHPAERRRTLLPSELHKQYDGGPRECDWRSKEPIGAALRGEVDLATVTAFGSRARNVAQVGPGQGDPAT
jgi:hypothetical protein